MILLQRLLIVGLMMDVSGCKFVSRNSAQVKVDAAQSAILDADIADGVIKVPSTDTPEVVLKKITAQLSYTAGALESIHGSPDVGRNMIKILSRQKVGDPASQDDEVRYATTLVLALPKEMSIPKTIRFALPASVNQTDREEIYVYHSEPFYNEFRDKCLDKKYSDKPSYKFWNYINPGLSGCPLDEITKQDQLASNYVKTSGSQFEFVGLTAALKPSGSSTTNKKPEYDQIWKDGKLVFVAIFTPGSYLSATDSGISAISNVIQALVKKYGKEQGNDGILRPKSANFDITKTWETIFEERREDGYFKLELDSQRGPMDFHFFMKDDIRGYVDTKDEEQSSDWKKLKSQIEGIGGNVDVFTHFGHSALGKNVRAFLKLPHFVPNQYSIFWFSACSSFMYLDQGLSELNQKLNPGTSPYKYFDVIANGFNSMFGTEAQDLLALTDAIVEKRQTYRELLDHFHPRQRPLVFGEEDNGNPF